MKTLICNQKESEYDDFWQFVVNRLEIKLKRLLKPTELEMYLKEPVLLPSTDITKKFQNLFIPS